MLGGLRLTVQELEAEGRIGLDRVERMLKHPALGAERTCIFDTASASTGPAVCVLGRCVGA